MRILRRSVAMLLSTSMIFSGVDISAFAQNLNSARQQEAASMFDEDSIEVEEDPEALNKILSSKNFEVTIPDFSLDFNKKILTPFSFENGYAYVAQGVIAAGLFRHYWIKWLKEREQLLESKEDLARAFMSDMAYDFLVEEFSGNGKSTPDLPNTGNDKLLENIKVDAVDGKPGYTVMDYNFLENGKSTPDLPNTGNYTLLENIKNSEATKVDAVDGKTDYTVMDFNSSSGDGRVLGNAGNKSFTVKDNSGSEYSVVKGHDSTSSSTGEVETKSAEEIKRLQEAEEVNKLIGVNPTNSYTIGDKGIAGESAIGSEGSRTIRVSDVFEKSFESEQTWNISSSDVYDDALVHRMLGKINKIAKDCANKNLSLSETIDVILVDREISHFMESVANTSNEALIKTRAPMIARALYQKSLEIKKVDSILEKYFPSEYGKTLIAEATLPSDESHAGEYSTERLPVTDQFMTIKSSEQSTTRQVFEFDENYQKEVGQVESKEKETKIKVDSTSKTTELESNFDSQTSSSVNEKVIQMVHKTRLQRVQQILDGVKDGVYTADQAMDLRYSLAKIPSGQYESSRFNGIPITSEELNILKKYIFFHELENSEEYLPKRATEALVRLSKQYPGIFNSIIPRKSRFKALIKGVDLFSYDLSKILDPETEIDPRLQETFKKAKRFYEEAPKGTKSKVTTKFIMDRASKFLRGKITDLGEQRVLAELVANAFNQDPEMVQQIQSDLLKKGRRLDMDRVVTIFSIPEEDLKAGRGSLFPKVGSTTKIKNDSKGKTKEAPRGKELWDSLGNRMLTSKEVKNPTPRLSFGDWWKLSKSGASKAMSGGAWFLGGVAVVNGVTCYYDYKVLSANEKNIEETIEAFTQDLDKTDEIVIYEDDPLTVEVDMMIESLSNDIVRYAGQGLSVEGVKESIYQYINDNISDGNIVMNLKDPKFYSDILKYELKGSDFYTYMGNKTHNELINAVREYVGMIENANVIAEDPNSQNNLNQQEEGLTQSQKDLLLSLDLVNIISHFDTTEYADRYQKAFSKVPNQDAIHVLAEARDNYFKDAILDMKDIRTEKFYQYMGDKTHNELINAVRKYVSMIENANVIAEDQESQNNSVQQEEGLTQSQKDLLLSLDLVNRISQFDTTEHADIYKQAIIDVFTSSSNNVDTDLAQARDNYFRGVLDDFGDILSHSLEPDFDNWKQIEEKILSNISISNVDLDWDKIKDTILSIETSSDVWED